MNPGDSDRPRNEIADLRNRLERTSEELARLERRLWALENGPLFRLTRGVALLALYRKRQLGHWLLNSPLHSVYLALRPRPSGASAYAASAARREGALPSLEWHREQAAAWPRKPRISVLMATWNPRREWLQAAIASVIAQSYFEWELCICDDASPAPWVEEYLRECAASDSRIRVARNLEHRGISGALNAAGTLAGGELITFL